MTQPRLPSRRCRAALALTCVAAALWWLATDAAAQAPNAFTVQPLPARTVNVASGPRGMAQFLTDGDASVTMPVTPSMVAGYSRQSGFQLNVNSNWPGQYGYRPVVFTLRTQKPVAADQRITIEFSAGDWYVPRAKAINVEESFTFPAGATEASKRILVPRYQDWQLAAWRVRVNGRSDDLLAIDQLYFSGIGIGQAGLGAMAVDLTPEQMNEATAVLQSSASGLGVNMMAMEGKPLPTDWREYSSLDVFIMPVDRLPALAKDDPAALDALMRWVRAGGNLWLIEAGSWWRLATADRVLRGEDADDEETESQDDGANRDRLLAGGWRFASIGERSGDPVESALALSGFDYGETRSWRDLVAGVIPSVAASRERFLVRGYGLGGITAFRVDVSPRSLSGADGSTDITQSALGPRMSWGSRHGNQPDSTNDEFNNLLIPGVGVAPVGQFQFLITVFVLAIGPLNYWLLKRKNKLPMLLATAPAAAVATTLVLFAYGLVVDGFGTLARARTLTLLDQRSGEAVSWGRFSYYAGIAPRSGLRVPTDQLMYPIMPRWQATRYGRMSASPRYLQWNDDQRLRRGWLASRTPTQYHAIAARPSKKQLDLRLTDGGLSIVNRLGVDVTHLAVEDHDGRTYWCEKLDDGAGAVVEATDQNKVAGSIRQLFTANLPESPDGADHRLGYAGPYMSHGLMEARMGAINSPLVRSWGGGKYIAFTKQAIELDLGLGDLDEESSFHVIEGSW